MVRPGSVHRMECLSSRREREAPGGRARENLAESPPAAMLGSMPRPGSERCDGHHEMADCDVERALRAGLYQRHISNKNEAFSRARECYEKAGACYKRCKQVDKDSPTTVAVDIDSAAAPPLP